VVWAIPEPGDTPADLYAAGFHPAAPDLGRFALCRHLRLPLPGWKPSSENRRILRKGEGLRLLLHRRADYAYTADRRRRWLEFAAQRFGPGVMPGERLDGLLGGRVVTHLLACHDAARDDREVATVLLYLEPPRMAHYYYAFYDLDHANHSLGLCLMTAAAAFFRDAGFQHLFLGTCYSESALYKTQFDGVEFFNGIAWSADLRQLKFLVRRDARSRHLLEEPEFLGLHDGLQGLARRTAFRHRPAPGE
jgi:hypothetical protein